MNIERSEMKTEGIIALFKSLIPILDDLERATQYQEPIKLIFDNLIKALQGNDVQLIESLHQAFDPNQHEALIMEKSSEFPNGTVIKQLSRGYKIGNRVIRPAKVVVSTAD